MIDKETFLNKNEDRLNELWESGIDGMGDEITESDYMSFELRCWKEFDDRQTDIALDAYYRVRGVL